MRLIYLCIVLCMLGAVDARAVVKTSQEDGDWSTIAWWPAGEPQAGDTVVINTNVSGMLGGNFGELIVDPEKHLTIVGDRPQVESILSYGRITIVGSVTLRVMGSVVNAGVIDGEGTVEMIGADAVLSGGGAFGNLSINARPAGSLAMASPLVATSLSIADGNQLDIGSYTAVVSGAYISSSTSGALGLAGTGLVTLRGSAFGTVRAPVRFEDPPTGPLSKRTIPTITGYFGDSTGGVSLHASRRIDLSMLVGPVTIDSGAALITSGIGENGTITVPGNVTVLGTLTSDDERYRWVVGGDFINRGMAQGITLVMSAAACTVRSDSGIWDPSMSLIYQSSSNGRLRIIGELALSTLDIAGASAADTNIVVDAGSYPLIVRHGFTSNAASHNRLVSDSIVRIRSTSRGMVSGTTIFDGFWDAHIAGIYGRADRYVRISAPKEVTGAFTVLGSLEVDKQYLLTIDTSAAVQGNGGISGSIALARGAEIRFDGDVSIGRGITGDGVLRLAGVHARFDLSGEVGEGVLVEIGGAGAATVRAERSLLLPRLSVRAGGHLEEGSDARIVVTREFSSEIAYEAGVLPASRACGVAAPAPQEISASIEAADSAAVPGAGYWRRFSVPTTEVQRGAFVDLPLAVPVHAGWNLIGGASLSVHAADIRAEGTEILSGFFLYHPDGTAERVTLLEPGRGYWIRVSERGSLVLDRSR